MAQGNDVGQAAGRGQRQHQDTWDGEHFLDAHSDSHRDVDHRFSECARCESFWSRSREIQKLAVQIERELAEMPNTRSVFAERTVGGYFLDFSVNREAAARYGLKVGDVNDIIESAIGGKNITTTVEGRERYPVNTRYARDFRQDIDALKRVLVPTPTGAQVPISLLADIRYKTG